MRTEKVLLSQLKVNVKNPRTITQRKLDLLVERLLAFPKMIAIRPVVVDEKMIALGGNMRLRAFGNIAQMTLDDIATKLAPTKNFQKLTKAEQESLLAQWRKWLEKPTVEIVKASTLSEAEKQEFVIADNSSFGEWDYDKLANEWNNEELNSWGLDVWQPETPQYGNGGSKTEELTNAETGEHIPFDGSNLPQELQGQDINPDDLPKIEGSNETAMERIIIVYPKERSDEVASLVGLSKIEKVVYNIDEILGGAEDENKQDDA